MLGSWRENVGVRPRCLYKWRAKLEAIELQSSGGNTGCRILEAECSKAMRPAPGRMPHGISLTKHFARICALLIPYLGGLLRLVSGVFASTGGLSLRSSKEPVTVGSVKLLLRGPAAIFKGG
jgi:hypothetical protein